MKEDGKPISAEKRIELARLRLRTAASACNVRSLIRKHTAASVAASVGLGFLMGYFPAVGRAAASMLVTSATSTLMKSFGLKQ